MGQTNHRERFIRTTCPRNCYASCSMIAHVKNDRLIKVTGDPKHGFSRGKLCAKGYQYPEFVYRDNRLKYPLRRSGERGEGKWERISWEEAFSTVADKLIESFDRRGTFRSVGYNTFSGNLGFLQHAMQGFFSYLGDHTYSVGNPCLGTGKLALERQRGGIPYHEPETMADADSIVIWGANPAVTNIHQMKFIHAARDRGAVLIVIDPVFTPTAKVADIYIQVKPGSDAALGALLIKHLNEQNALTQPETIEGFDVFQRDLNQADVNQLLSETGIGEEALLALVKAYQNPGTVATWIGFGMQRYAFGDKSVRMVDALAILTENPPRQKRPVFYIHPGFFTFHDRVDHELTPGKSPGSRGLSYNRFAETCLQFQEEPLDLLWIFNRNPLSQDESVEAWKELLDSVPFLVVSELTMTKTATYADLILPVTSHFEQYDLHVSYWNNWLSLNEPAITPYHESRSDLSIARGVSEAMNERRPGISAFPKDLTELSWIKQVAAVLSDLQPELKDAMALRFSPLPLKAEAVEEKRSFLHHYETDCSFLIDSFQHRTGNEPYDFQVITAQSLLHIHSQFETGMIMPDHLHRTEVAMSDRVAEKEGLQDGDPVLIFNDAGEVRRNVKRDKTIADGILIMRQGGEDPVNQLMKERQSPEMKKMNSTSFYDNRASMIKAGRSLL